MISCNKLCTQGLCSQNPATKKLLGLCPLLAVSNTFINSLSLGIATLLVLISANLCISCLRKFINYDLRIPIFVVLIATIVTILQQFLAAFAFSLYENLGIFFALITTNCLIMSRAESFSSKNTPKLAFFDSLGQGLGFLLILCLLGFMRELIGNGTILKDAKDLFGSIANNIGWHLLPDNTNGFLLANLPSGAFIGLGLIIALWQYLEQKN